MSAVERLPKSITIEFRDAWSASYYGDEEDRSDDETVAACIAIGVRTAEQLVAMLIYTYKIL